MLSVAVAAVILSGVFVVLSQRIFSQRIPEVTDGGNYASASQELVDGNRGLRAALECADSCYEFLGLETSSHAGGSSMRNDDRYV